MGKDIMQLIKHLISQPSDSYIEYVDSKKSELGAVSNRIDSSIRNQQQMHEDESSSRSQMVDADYATESSKMIESDIMTNATSQMLMQANARPGLVASLLS
jgi:flagellin